MSRLLQLRELVFMTACADLGAYVAGVMDGFVRRGGIGRGGIAVGGRHPDPESEDGCGEQHDSGIMHCAPPETEKYEGAPFGAPSFEVYRAIEAVSRKTSGSRA